MVLHAFAQCFSTILIVGISFFSIELLSMDGCFAEMDDCFAEEASIYCLQGLSPRSCVNVGIFSSVWYYTIFAEEPFATEVHKQAMSAFPEMYGSPPPPFAKKDAAGKYTFLVPQKEMYRERDWHLAIEMGVFLSPKEKDWEARTGVLLLLNKSVAFAETGAVKGLQQESTKGFISWYNMRLEDIYCDHVSLEWDMWMIRWRTMLDYTVKILPESFLYCSLGIEGFWGHDDVDSREYLDVNDIVQVDGAIKNGQTLMAQTMWEYNKEALGPSIEFGSIWSVTQNLSLYGTMGYTLLWSAGESSSKNQYWLNALTSERKEKAFPYTAYYTDYMPVWDLRVGVEWSYPSEPCNVTAALGWKGSYFENYYYRNIMKDAALHGDKAEQAPDASVLCIGAGNKEYTSLSLGGVELHFMVRY